MNDNKNSSEEESEDIAELPSQNEMKNDLIRAIEEELKERDILMRDNEDLQKRIITLDPSFEQYDKQGGVV
jgi:hypothetical protein